jgi:zinc-finger of transposase IS204/IS1001/IS1096/IS1165
MQYTMYYPAVFSATLGLSHPWQVIAINFTKEERRLDITIDFVHGSSFFCPTCGAEKKCCESDEETWFHDDYFRYATYLHARVPKLQCSCCGVDDIERPWSRTGSKFTLIQPT